VLILLFFQLQDWVFLQPHLKSSQLQLQLHHHLLRRPYHPMRRPAANKLCQAQEKPDGCTGFWCASVAVVMSLASRWCRRRYWVEYLPSELALGLPFSTPAFARESACTSAPQRLKRLERELQPEHAPAACHHQLE